MLPCLLLLLSLTIFLLPSPASPTKTPLLPINFPDPTLVQDPLTGTWYAFGTGSFTPNSTTPAFRNIQAALSLSPSENPLAGPWTYLPTIDLLPNPGPWTAGPGSQTWAPSVVRLNDTAWVLYYAGQMGGNNSAFHCIGAATADSVLGPYTPLPEPLACPLDRGGAIDPAGFLDPATGRRWVVYKVDGNSMGSGGECGNGVEPGRATPILLQEVDDQDGVTLVGEPLEILDREAAVDGPLVEAPELFFARPESQPDGRGRYVLFYSNHCWDDPGYSVNYAVGEVGGGVAGPYRRSGSNPLVGTGDAFNITAPGGAAVVASQPGNGGGGGGWMVFHGDCAQGRCLYGAEMVVLGETVVAS
ncbi:hypothetical protein VTI74DRAFT_5818 [Chaetomium olivicolor]